MQMRILSIKYFLFAMLIMYGASVWADDLQDIAKLGAEGAPLMALDRLEMYERQHSNDVQAELLKGILLSMADKKPEALKHLLGLLAKHPDMPQIENNMAVIYAGQKDYDKAIKLLESLIKKHPEYLNAQKNLGDIYTEMALHIYEKVAITDVNDIKTKNKVDTLKRISDSDATVKIGSNPEVAQQNSVPKDNNSKDKSQAALASTQSALKKPLQSELPSVKVVDAPQAMQNGIVKNASSAIPANVNAKASRPSQIAIQNQPVSNAKTPLEVENENIGHLVDAWAKAWAEQNVSMYLSFYSDQFNTPNGETLQAWKAIRLERLSKPRSITIKLSQPQILLSNGVAQVSFMQDYLADGKHMVDKKQLSLTKLDGKWLIVKEQVVN